MGRRGKILREVMLSTGTTQSELSRLSGIHQPSISQFLSGRVEFSDGQLDRLLSCMGYRLEVARRPLSPIITRSERRSWLLHRSLAGLMTQESLEEWLPTIDRNLHRLASGTQGQPHERNLERWAALTAGRDVVGLKRVMTGLDRESIEMREVSPLGGLLPNELRVKILEDVADAPRTA